jgi:hypothetical protein
MNMDLRNTLIAELKQLFDDTFHKASRIVRLIEDICEDNALKDIELQTLHSQARQLEKQCDEYQSQVFRISNPSEMSDKSIFDEMSGLYAGLSNWVEGLVHGLEGFDRYWPQLREFLKSEKYITGLKNLDRWTMASLFDGELLMMATFKAILSFIFSPMLVGASPKERSVLAELYDSVAYIEPRKGIQHKNTFLQCYTGMANCFVFRPKSDKRMAIRYVSSIYRHRELSNSAQIRVRKVERGD